MDEERDRIFHPWVMTVCVEGHTEQLFPSRKTWLKTQLAVDPALNPLFKPKLEICDQPRFEPDAGWTFCSFFGAKCDRMIA